MNVLGVGDGLYGLCLLDPLGARVDLSASRRAGRTVVLWLRDAPPCDGAPGDMPWPHDFQARLAAVEAAAYCVVPMAPSDGMESAGGLAILVDPQTSLVRAAGMKAPGQIILGPDERIIAVLHGEDPEAVLNICAQEHGCTAAAEIPTQAPVLIVRNVFEPELCNALIEAWERGDKQIDKVSMRQSATIQAFPDLKRRADISLDEPDLRDAARACIERRLVPEILRAFQYRVRYFEGVRVGCYDSATGGYFRRHRDNTTPLTRGRRFAVSINLNTGDYEGGQVRFPEFGRMLYSPSRGGAVIFSCALLHEALPVTSGRRFGAFTFAFEPTPESSPRVTDR